MVFAGYAAHAAEFSHVPFWFWNDALSEEEIARQMADFQGHGVQAFVIHPRAGLPRDFGWMSPRLLHYMGFAIGEAARRGMWVILYDEGMYPSGSSAGQVVAENPAYACRGYVRIDLDTARPDERIQGVRLDRSGEPVPGPDQTLVAVTRDRLGHRIAVVDVPVRSVIRGLHYVEDDPPRRADHREVPECLPPAGDILNPDAVNCFIRLVYETCYRAFSSHFGRTIKGVFTDEPSLLGRGARNGGLDPRPGTTGFLTHINRILGYDFTPHLPALWDVGEPDAERVRRDYHRAAEQRLEETYYQPISAWCEAHGVALCGHPGQADNIGQMRYFHIPGQDVVLRRIEPDKPSALEGPESTQAKNASSAMVHLGRRRNSNEFAGAFGHQLTFAEFRWLALWLLVRGCNLLIPHAFYYSIRGPRVDERPPDVGPHSRWWNEYRRLADLTGRLCWLNTDSVPVCDIAILGTADSLPWRSAGICFRHQRDFNYLEDRHLWEDARIDEAGVTVARMRYRAVIQEGPVRPEADSALALLADSGRLIPWEEREGAEALLTALDRLTRRGLILDPPAPGLRVRHVRKEGQDLYLLFNEERTPVETACRLADVGETCLLLEGDDLVEAPWRNGSLLKLPAHGVVVIAGTG